MSTENKRPLIEVKHLGKVFTRGKYVKEEVLSDINVNFYEGDVAFIVGPSGAGKSTFLRCLNRLERATTGEIYFEGDNILDDKIDIDKHRQKECGGRGGKLAQWREGALATCSLRPEQPQGSPSGRVVDSACQGRRCSRLGFDPWV